VSSLACRSRHSQTLEDEAGGEPLVLSKFLFGSTNATGQIDDERENEATKKLNEAVDAERRKRDEAVDAERRKRDEAERKRDEAERKLKLLEEQLKRLQATYT
jgi:hypothetical protein